MDLLERQFALIPQNKDQVAGDVWKTSTWDPEKQLPVEVDNTEHDGPTHHVFCEFSTGDLIIFIHRFQGNVQSMGLNFNTTDMNRCEPC